MPQSSGQTRIFGFLAINCLNNFKPKYNILNCPEQISFIFESDMPNQLLQYQIAISLIPGIGDVNAKKLISYCGAAEAVFRETKKNLLKIPGMGVATVNAILSQNVLERAEQEMLFIEKNEISTLYFLEKNYPTRLKSCLDSPVMLYYKGNANLNASRVVSVVGTRRSTAYGREVCDQLISDLTSPDLLVVSGLAYGIDTQAHRSSVENNIPTVGILAHGLDRLYPAQNRALSEKMVENGGLLTDFMSATVPDRENFPKRNRIVAGMADALVVVESAKRGGALITANIANSYNRDVFAFPGRVSDTYSEGCNYLIKTNKAALIQNAADIRYLMNWDDVKKPGRQAKLFRELNPEEQQVMEILKNGEPVGIDYIVMQSKLSNSKIAAILLSLEFDGMVSSLPGKMYKAV